MPIYKLLVVQDRKLVAYKESVGSGETAVRNLKRTIIRQILLQLFAYSLSLTSSL